MRSAEAIIRALALAAAAAALAGCSTIAADLRGAFGGGAAAAPAKEQESGKEGAKEAALPPVNPQAQRAFDEASLALKAGRTAEAQRGLVALTKSNPELAGPHANLGLIDMQAGKLAEAAAELEEAVRLSPAQPRYFNALGIVYRQQGAFAKARAAYEKAIALDPRYAPAQLNLGILFDLYLWDSARAVECYDRYLALSPGGDDKVKKWIADLKNRQQQQSMAKTQETK